MIEFFFFLQWSWLLGWNNKECERSFILYFSLHWLSEALTLRYAPKDVFDLHHGDLCRMPFSF